MNQKTKAVIYARFSSENQRDESIDAQIRAIQEYAKRNNIEIIEIYTDRARSATSDKRPDFQRMVKDSEKENFDMVIVHKLDRFSRDKYDSVYYKKRLLKNGVKVVSVTEQLDDSPESVILESVLEGMADYYSKNLAREAMKGMKETAYKCQHTGGTPPLGYDVDKETRKYIINPNEAEAVKLIFEKYLQGHTVMSIVNELNDRGYRTKKGVLFGTNSIRSIIKNEKYCGTFVFNKSASKDAFGRRNGSKTKDDKDIIRIKGGVPAIVTEDDYNRAQSLMESKRNGRGGRQKAKEIYLLSGIIKCKCGHAMYGNRRKPKGKPLYVSYRCGARHKKGVNSDCKTPEIRKEYIEDYVLTELENFLVNDEVASSIVENVNKYVDQENNVYREKLSYIKKEVTTIDGQIGNIIKAVMDGFSSEELKTKLDELKKEKGRLEIEKIKYSKEVTAPEIDVKTVREKLNHLREYVKTRNLPECRKLIKDFVKEVIVYEDHVEVKLNMVSFVFEGLDEGDKIKKKREDLYVKNSQACYHRFLREKGYEYSREVSNYGKG
ncbi:recombinase family protein [Ilyobacter polytropus]|uniref:Resolvase domain protein n=1 Tax=Ilyobacter polytropus (strain ATCC 51220 / DSM 2926 / LMG 16218 / CuHBu1) TaxID=572544 RepID=E3H9N3_ILYPC|nr:recombinase family protein [Ilyobacter polytropus]ADO83422.1 Resolvase domain protein [Ilyobacter polytropus DSM 2926]